MKRSAQTQDTGAATRRLASLAKEAQYGMAGPINQSRPVTDPQSQTAASLLSFNETARIVQGFITDTCAIGNVYRVQLEKNKQTVVGFLAPRTSCNLFGAREIHTLQPGTLVTCVWHEQLPWAQILGVIPPAGTDPKLSNHSVLHGATRNRVDEAHKHPMRMADGGYIPAFLAGRPFDATCVGETGWITETGVKAFVDSFMAMFGIEESCQISFHYHDMLARLSAYNFQLWTSTRESECFNDQDESLDWTGYAMYPWEQFGLAARADPTTVKTAREWQLEQPWYSKMEPVDDYMMPWHREREFHGYLGQGGKRCVIAPPIEFEGPGGDLGSQDGNDTSEGSRAGHTSYLDGAGTTDAKHPGLFDSFVTADGRLCVQSAKGISLVKRAAIMLPTRRRRPEDPNGDTPENYRFSGAIGGGPEHRITGDVTLGSSENTNFNRAMGIMDMHAYFFNYAGIHPFFYHDEDYKLWQESEAEWCDGTSEEIPDFGKLASEAYIDSADYEKTWNIDHRYGEQKFYTLSCGFELLDDGGVMITDGYGGSIRMTGGSVEISAPGDVWLKSGRNTNVWGGADVTVRAKNSFDISATDGDGRLKAENNMMALAGNSGRGGILLESRGSGDFNFDECGEKAQYAGVVIRAPNAPVVAWAPEVYLRTGGPGISYNGPIVLDSARGKGPLITYAEYANHYTDTGHFWHFNTVDENVGAPSASLTAQGLIVPGNMCLGGGLIADGGAAFNGTVSSSRGFVGQDCPFVGCLTDQGLQQILDAMDRCRELTEVEVPQFGIDYINEALRPRFYDERRPGTDDTILKGEFSFRVTEDYMTENFRVFEDRWQQLGRLTGKATNRWNERPVTCQGQDTYPYPGKEAFDSDTVFVQQDLTLFDAENGRSLDRGEQGEPQQPYSDPRFAEPNYTSLNDYTVIR